MGIVGPQTPKTLRPSAVPLGVRKVAYRHPKTLNPKP